MADLQRCAMQKLNNHNYQSWRFKVEMLLIQEKTWHVISEAPVDPVREAWTKADAKFHWCFVCSLPFQSPAILLIFLCNFHPFFVTLSIVVHNLVVHHDEINKFA